MQRYSSTTYNNGPAGFTQSVHSTESPYAKASLLRSTAIGGTHITTQQHNLGYSQTHIQEASPISPARITTVKHAHGSPGRIVTAVSPPLSPVRTHTSTTQYGTIGGAVTTQTNVNGPPINSMLRMTSSPLRKPITTTRTNFLPGLTTTEEIATDPYAPPMPFPGETVAVTRTQGLGGGISSTTSVDPYGGVSSVLRENRSPVRTYTTTVYEDGDIPRTYTTTFEDQPALAPPRVHTTSTTTFGGMQSSYVSQHNNGFGVSQVEHVTNSPVSEHRTTTTLSPGRCTKVTSTRATFDGVHTSMGYI